MSRLNSFNSNLEKLLKNIIKLFPDQKEDIEKYYKFPVSGDIYIKLFFENCKSLGKDISEKNEIIFSEEYIILPEVKFNLIWNDEDIDDESKETIWKYLHTLYIFSYEFQKDKDVNEILEQLKNIQQDNSDLDEQTKTFLSIIDNLSGKNDIDMDKLENSELNNEDEDEDNTSGFTLPNIPDLSNLMNGSIGQLAQEIVSDLDTSKLNLEDPSMLLKNLMSGNIGDDSGLMDLVKNITGKIHDKINSGELNEEHLFSEANNVMNTFNNSSNSNSLFNNMFNQAVNTGINSGLDSDMSEENQEIVKNCQQIINNKAAVNSNPQQMLKNAKLQKRRELLRKKLELKKKIEENAKQLEKEEKMLNDSQNLEEWNEFQ